MIASHRTLLITLLASIAVNIVLIGYLFIQTFFEKNETLANPITQHEISGAFQSLPLENRNEIKKLIRRHQLEIIANQSQIRLLRLQVAELMMQETLDKQKLAELFEKIYSLTSKNIELGQKTLYQTFTILPFSERQKIAEAIERSTRQSKRILRPPTTNI